MKGEPVSFLNRRFRGLEARLEGRGLVFFPADNLLGVERPRYQDIVFGDGG